ncbi:photosystem II 5 kDa protein, chloroplastic-like [Ziziphus jujuba]|uniref:Photosystem II 5 kDa protein, chloroplastic-like n=1 Tax=Ziziphus jujuba TaxID=326968 RepID=A0A6P4A783_ZIZJJ|nr:photosystem II 5 kDa protein, chloroplastic-like [Ziziphus jujuba]
MASFTMTASFLGGATLASPSPINNSRRLVVAKAAGAAEGEKVNLNSETKKESNNGRRDLMFAAAAAAVCSAAGIALADPKPGTPEAKKAYAPICVTMPTAKVCHK